MSAHFLKQISRLWRFGNTDDFDSIKEAMSQIGGKYDQLPIEVHGKVLDPEELIENINVADDEMIMFEWRIVFDPHEDGGWAFNPQEKRKTRLRGFQSRLTEEKAALTEEERM